MVITAFDSSWNCFGSVLLHQVQVRHFDRELWSTVVLLALSDKRQTFLTYPADPMGYASSWQLCNARPEIMIAFHIAR
jgi:hypothetical protein